MYKMLEITTRRISELENAMAERSAVMGAYERRLYKELINTNTLIARECKKRIAISKGRGAYRD